MTSRETLKTSAKRLMALVTNIPLSRTSFLSASNLAIIKPRLNLLVIGAGKCGTTTIHDWLSRHPDIFMSRPWKEPNYFAPPEVLKPFNYTSLPKTRIMAERMLVGYKRQRYFGEASPIYTNGNLIYSNPIPRIVHDYNPGMKIIYMIRNPYDRIVSHARQDIYKGRLAKDTKTIPSDHFRYLAQTSCYGHHLTHWYSEFPPDQIKLVVLEELHQRPREILNEIADFLGLSPFLDIPLDSRNVTARRATGIAELKFPSILPEITALIEKDITLLTSLTGRELQPMWNLDRSVHAAAAGSAE